jgi:hypothetical protein
MKKHIKELISFGDTVYTERIYTIPFRVIYEVQMCYQTQFELHNTRLRGMIRFSFAFI